MMRCRKGSDSTHERHPAGKREDARLTWRARTPAAPQRPAIVVHNVDTADKLSLVACKAPRPPLAYRQTAASDGGPRGKEEHRGRARSGEGQDQGGWRRRYRRSGARGRGQARQPEGKIKDKAGNLRESAEDKLDD